MRRNHWIVPISMVITVWLSVSGSARDAEAQRSPEWQRTLEAAKQEGRIVIAIPPANELRREMESVLKQKLGLEAELISNPGPRNASRIVAERKAGVRYFDALIVGTGTAVTLAHDGLLEPIESFLMLPEVKDPKEWWGGHIWDDNLSTNRYLYSFLADVSTTNVWYNSNWAKPEELRSFDDYRNGKPRSLSAIRAFRAPANRSGPLCGRSKAKSIFES
jgi:hypothetical protein